MQTDSVDLTVEALGLTKKYGATTVLDCLSLCVKQGELLVVLGDSGSGKSTLLRLMAGLEKPLRGSIRISGVDQASVPPHRRNIALIFQDRNGYDHLTVRQNLELASKCAREQGQIPRWVDSMQLKSVLNQKLAQLSGGQAQRVSIARAMLSGKNLVLMDEPLAHLNQSLREEIRELILTTHQETKRTFVYVTHDSDEAFFLADRIAVLASGQIQQIDGPRAIHNAPNSTEVARLLGQPTIDVISLPKSWLDSEDCSDDAAMICGVRCHDWIVNRVEKELPLECPIGSLGLSMTREGLMIKGTIAGCRWMGFGWLFEIKGSQRVRVACEANCSSLAQTVLHAAEEWSRTLNSSKPRGYLEAIIPRSSIKTFGSK